VIVCLVANPSIDKLFEVERLVRGDIHRPLGFEQTAGGKGLNVARAVSVLGARADEVLQGPKARLGPPWTKDHRVAFAALKHTHEMGGDSWRPKEEYGPSDERAEGGRASTAPTAGGVDANASKAHLYGVARELEIEGRSRMSKDELVEAIGRENDRRSRRALEDER